MKLGQYYQFLHAFYHDAKNAGTKSITKRRLIYLNFVFEIQTSQKKARTLTLVFLFIKSENTTPVFCKTEVNAGFKFWADSPVF